MIRILNKLFPKTIRRIKDYYLNSWLETRLNEQLGKKLRKYTDTYTDIDGKIYEIKVKFIK